MREALAHTSRSLALAWMLALVNVWRDEDLYPIDFAVKRTIRYVDPHEGALSRPERCFFYGNSSLAN